MMVTTYKELEMLNGAGPVEWSREIRYLQAQSKDDQALSAMLGAVGLESELGLEILFNLVHVEAKGSTGHDSASVDRFEHLRR